MIFWFLAAALTLAVVVAVVWPLLRGRFHLRQAADYDIEVYRDQLDEVERSRKRGLISDAEAEAAKTEIGRRILAADQRREGAAQADSTAPGWSAKVAAAALVLAIPVGAAAIYVHYGSPGMEDLPLAAREDVLSSPELAGAQTAPDSADESGPSAAQLAQAEEDLTQRVEADPQDAEAWEFLGLVRMRSGDYGAAAESFSRLVELTGTPRAHTLYGEALVMAHDGLVTPRAHESFRAAARAQSDDPRPGYYLGLADLQRGNAEAALDRWAELVAAAPPDAPWLEVVATQMAQAERELDIEPGTTFAHVAPESPVGAATAGGPTREQMEAVENLSPAERQAMIEEMVAGLAQRLEENPEDLDGWLQLARSYEVLERFDAARDAAGQAAELAPENVEILAYYARLLRATEGGGLGEESVAVSRRILDLAPDHPQALWFVAMDELANGNRDAAREKFERALDQLPSDAPQTAELRRQAERMLEGE